MKLLNKFTGFLKITLFTIAVLSLVKYSHSQTWVTQNSGTANTLHGVWFLDNLKGFAVGDLGTVRYTTNGGTVWQQQASGVFFYTIVTNEFTSTKRMLLVK